MEPVDCPFCGIGKAGYIPDPYTLPMCGSCQLKMDKNLFLPARIRLQRRARSWLALCRPWNQNALLEQQLGLAPRNYGRMQDLFWMECFKGFLKLYELSKILSAKIRGSPVIAPLTSRMAVQVFQIEGIAMLIARFELWM